MGQSHKKTHRAPFATIWSVNVVQNEISSAAWLTFIAIFSQAPPCPSPLLRIQQVACMERYLCIHCHFYQPPRENPWLEAIELQDSAEPYHDWNDRITAECYAPNSVARILGTDGRIQHIVNNYESISFNFGPTLLSWMENFAPKTYASILDA